MLLCFCQLTSSLPHVSSTAVNSLVCVLFLVGLCQIPLFFFLIKTLFQQTHNSRITSWENMSETLSLFIKKKKSMIPTLCSIAESRGLKPMRKTSVLLCIVFELTSDSFVSGLILAGEQPTPPWSDGSRLNMKMGRENPRVGTQNDSIMASSFPR